VLDFLAGEVLARQPTHVRAFLLETSILDGLTGSLCDALTGRSDGQEMLERLERDNLFVL
jgi:LuxR family maltose regulon positive regulatory protein